MLPPKEAGILFHCSGICSNCFVLLNPVSLFANVKKIEFVPLRMHLNANVYSKPLRSDHTMNSQGVIWTIMIYSTRNLRSNSSFSCLAQLRIEKYIRPDLDLSWNAKLIYFKSPQSLLLSASQVAIRYHVRVFLKWRKTTSRIHLLSAPLGERKEISLQAASDLNNNTSQHGSSPSFTTLESSLPSMHSTLAHRVTSHPATVLDFPRRISSIRGSMVGEVIEEENEEFALSRITDTSASEPSPQSLVDVVETALWIMWKRENPMLEGWCAGYHSDWEMSSHSKCSVLQNSVQCTLW